MDFDIDNLIKHKSNSEIPQSILDPFDYLVNIPSNNKNVRSTFLKGFNELYYHIDNDKLLEEIDKVISVFHNASLLIDDIEDSSEFRRGFPTAHMKYGIPLTINSGNLMYFVSLRQAGSLTRFCDESDENKLRSSKKVYEILVDEMLNLHHGQGLDIFWRDNKDISKLPTIKEYLQMVMNKTGGLFRLSVQLLEIFAKDLTYTKTSLANLLGIIYQIRDDYLNLVDDRYSHMKGVAGEDLIEGKLSLPILHCLLNSPGSIVEEIIFMKDRKVLSTNAKLIKECINYMDEIGSLDFTRKLLKQYHEKARNMILEDANDEDCILINLVDKLCDI